MYSARITGTDAASARKFWSEAEKKPALGIFPLEVWALVSDFLI